MALKVGDTIYLLDHGKRYRAHPIIGETKQSWWVGSGPRPWKVNKKTLQSKNRDYAADQWFTEEGMKSHAWIHEHRHNIAGRVQVCNDMDVLKQIATLVGYDA